MWAPDVNKGASTSLTAHFASTPKVSKVSVLLQVFVDTVVFMMKLHMFFGETESNRPAACTFGDVRKHCMFAGEPYPDRTI